MLALRQFGTSRDFSALVSTLLWAGAPIAEPQAATLTGVVVALSDGDTLTILDDAHQQHRVRLAGIDAPERRQPFAFIREEQKSSSLLRPPQRPAADARPVATG